MLANAESQLILYHYLRRRFISGSPCRNVGHDALDYKSAQNEKREHSCYFYFKVLLLLGLNHSFISLLCPVLREKRIYGQGNRFQWKARAYTSQWMFVSSLRLYFYFFQAPSWKSQIFDSSFPPTALPPPSALMAHSHTAGADLASPQRGSVLRTVACSSQKHTFTHTHWHAEVCVF